MPATTDLTEPLARLSGPFKAVDAGRVGISPWQLRQMVRFSEVRRVLREVYVCAEHPDTLQLRAAALALVVPPHAVICDRTAAWLWDVDTLRPWELAMLPPLEMFVLRGRTRVRRPEVAGGERDLRPEDLVQVGDVCVTTPLRTSLDLACGLSRYQAVAAMDGLARVHGAGADELRSLLPRYRRRRGVVQARELVPLVDGRSESTGESFTRMAIHDAGLPRPEPQFWVEVRGVPTYRLDLAYPALKICVEYDGQEFHSSDEAKERDERRRTGLRDSGWIVIVVTRDDLRGRALDGWLSELRAALRDRMR